MEQYKTNQINTKKNNFKTIENHFMILYQSSKNNIKKNKSHLNLSKRLFLKKKSIINFDKNPLDQIGDDDLIFNNDKLITNIKLDNFENLSPRDSLKDENAQDIRFSASVKTKSKRKSLTPEKGEKIKKNAQNSILSKTSEINSMDLNCNKIKHKIANIKLNNNHKNIKNMNHINQFINKPIKGNNNIQRRNVSMTPYSNKSTKISYHNSFSKLKCNKYNDLHNDSISLSSISKIGTRSCIRGRSMPNTRKSKPNMHFPNKSSIKNKDKLYIELKKIFGEKINLNDDLYQNMADLDKKNCITFLLESIKELININKTIQSKLDTYKEINESKDKQIKENKNQIKELKKEILKLNKIIKTNIQMNRKLNQSLDNLKLQLNKEKTKNREYKDRCRSNERKYHNIKNELNDFSLTTVKKRSNMSQDRLRKLNDFTNKEKKQNMNRNAKNDSIKEKKNKTIDINLKINDIKIEEKDNNNDSNEIKKTDINDNINNNTDKEESKINT